MTTDQLFDWMRRHRVQSPGCSRCGGQSVVYFMDGLERPVCYGCIFTARDRATAVPVEDILDPDAAVVRRLHTFHLSNVPACPLCDDRQQVLHARWHSGANVQTGCWYCEDEEAA